MFRPFFASEEILSLLLVVKKTIKPGEFESRSPVVKNKTYEQRYYENYVYYVATVTDAEKIKKESEGHKTRMVEKKLQDELAKKPKEKGFFDWW